MERRQADTIPLSTDPKNTDPKSLEPKSDEPADAGSGGSVDRVYPAIGPSQPAHSQPGPSQPGPPSGPAALSPAQPGRRHGLPRSIIAAIVVGVLIISSAVALHVATGALSNLNPFRNGVVQERTIDRSSPAVLKAITDLGEFEAASGYYQLVVDVEKDVSLVPSFLAGRRELFIAAGTVPVQVDLRGLGNGAVQVSQNRTSATITLPKPTLGRPNLDLAHSYVYSQQRGVINRLGDALGSGSADQQQQLYTLATQKLAQAAAQSNDLTSRAETNTRSMLSGLLRSLGFTTVTINFSS